MLYVRIYENFKGYGLVYIFDYVIIGILILWYVIDVCGLINVILFYIIGNKNFKISFIKDYIKLLDYLRKYFEKL